MAANDSQYASIPMPGDIACKNTEASVDLSAGQVVKLDASHLVSGTQSVFGVILPTANTDYCFGVVMESIPNGKTGRVRTMGVAQVICSAAVTAGAVLMPASSAGKVLTQTAAKPQIGQALTGTATDADKLLVNLSFALNA